MIQINLKEGTSILVVALSDLRRTAGGQEFRRSRQYVMHVDYTGSLDLHELADAEYALLLDAR